MPTIISILFILKEILKGDHNMTVIKPEPKLSALFNGYLNIEHVLSEQFSKIMC